jgi:hypothetical protein
MWRFLRSLVVVAILVGIVPTAVAHGVEQAARLSDAVGGSFESIGGEGAASGAGQGKLVCDVPLRPGRNEEFRRRVTSTLARSASAQSHFATSAH